MPLTRQKKTGNDEIRITQYKKIVNNTNNLRIRSYLLYIFSKKADLENKRKLHTRHNVLITKFII